MGTRWRRCRSRRARRCRSRGGCDSRSRCRGGCRGTGRSRTRRRCRADDRRNRSELRLEQVDASVGTRPKRADTVTVYTFVLHPVDRNGTRLAGDYIVVRDVLALAHVLDRTGFFGGFATAGEHRQDQLASGDLAWEDVLLFGLLDGGRQDPARDAMLVEQAAEPRLVPLLAHQRLEDRFALAASGSHLVAAVDGPEERLCRRRVGVHGSGLRRTLDARCARAREGDRCRERRGDHGDDDHGDEPRSGVPNLADNGHSLPPPPLVTRVGLWKSNGTFLV